LNAVEDEVIHTISSRLRFSKFSMRFARLRLTPHLPSTKYSTQNATATNFPTGSIKTIKNFVHLLNVSKNSLPKNNNKSSTIGVQTKGKRENFLLPNSPFMHTATVGEG
jgi:hypothetical protein